MIERLTENMQREDLQMLLVALKPVAGWNERKSQTAQKIRLRIIQERHAPTDDAQHLGSFRLHDSELHSAPAEKG